MIKYLVTYCVMDDQIGSNIFWHSCILLSQYREHDKIEVLDNWGFYGIPSTTHEGKFSFIKKIIGLNIDFNGNHGVLRHEELRYLDLAYALHGVTFEITEIKFIELQDRCNRVFAEQQQAIEEIAKYLGLEVDPKHKIYPYENHSRFIFAIEKLKATQEQRHPRLLPFEINPTLSWSGLSLHNSLNCKSTAISLLTGVLTQTQIDRITENGKYPNVPRLSGTMEEIFLHSSGPLRTHTKSSGEVVYYRNLMDEGVKLHWTLPPQEIEALSTDTNKLFQININYHDEIKSVTQKLQRAEWVFINAKLEDKYQRCQQFLIKKIRNCYEAFSYPEPKNPFDYKRATHFFKLFFPFETEEKAMQKKIQKANVLLDELYIALTGKLEIHSETEINIDSETDYSPITALANYLPTKYRKDLCTILKRAYIEPVEEILPCTIS